MYHKIKNSLAALGMVGAFAAGTLLLVEPVPAQPAAHDVAPAFEAVAADELALVVVRGTSQLRLQAGMPYYSFGAIIPRREES